MKGLKSTCMRPCRTGGERRNRPRLKELFVPGESGCTRGLAESKGKKRGVARAASADRVSASQKCGLIRNTYLQQHDVEPIAGQHKANLANGRQGRHRVFNHRLYSHSHKICIANLRTEARLH